MVFMKNLLLGIFIAVAPVCHCLYPNLPAVLTPSPPHKRPGRCGATEAPEEENSTVPPDWPAWNPFSTSVSAAVQQSLKEQWAANSFGVPRNLTRKTLGQEDLICELKTRVPLRMIRAGDGPFSGDEWEKVLPAEKLGPFKTCAVVMSSGSIKNSALGVEIDSHDAILRFNTAPTDKYSADVGNRTTIRLMNSQVVIRAGFCTDPLYSTGALIVWQSAPYSRDLHAWFNNQKPSFLQNYRECRRLRPEQPFYILSPSFQWDLWDIIQENSLMDIQPNTPSSGMLGVAVMMNLCEQVSVYEFLPSHRKTELCHYFEKDKNWQCTMGHYHPLKFEKDIVKRLHQGTEYDIYNSGKIKLCGFSQHSCP